MPPFPETEHDGGCMGEGWVFLSLKHPTMSKGDARVEMESPVSGSGKRSGGQHPCMDVPGAEAT